MDEDIEWIREDDEPKKERIPEEPEAKAADIKQPVPEEPKPEEWIREENGSKNLDIKQAAPQEEEPTEWIREEDESKTLDISECERQLAATTEATKTLLDDMKQKAKKIDESNKQIHEDIAALRRKTIEDDAQIPIEAAELPCSLPPNVDAVSVGAGHLQEITGVALFPGGNVLVADLTLGLILFSFDGRVLKTVNRPEWKKPRCPIYHKEHVLFICDLPEGRHIIKLTASLDYVARIEGPRFIADREIHRDRIAIAHTDNLYMIVCGINFSGLYELSPIGQWTELDYKQSESYTDIVAFATIGPITQLLVIEARKSYVLQISIRESAVVDRRRLAICERPNSIAKDEAGRLFVVSHGVVKLVNTIQWVAMKAVAVGGVSPVCGLVAMGGLLAIPGRDVVRLQRFSFR